MRLLLPLIVILSACGSATSESGAGIDRSALFESVNGDDFADKESLALDVFKNRETWLEHLAGVARPCVAKVDELDGARTLFHGCWDWHSSVHAHWAVLRVSLEGIVAADRIAREIDARLTEDALAKVTEELAADPSYEMPYGRAWYLRLALDHEKWSRSTRMRASADAVAASMLRYFEETTPDPAAGDYKNHSWAIAQLLAYFRHSGARDGLDAVNALVDAHYVQKPLVFDPVKDSTPSAFFSPYWSWVYVLAKAQDDATLIRLVPPERVTDAMLRPVGAQATREEVHHLGMNWSRSWAVKAYAARLVTQPAQVEHATRMANVYRFLVQTGLQRHARYVGDYYAYDHWVPQFAIYAIVD